MYRNYKNGSVEADRMLDHMHYEYALDPYLKFIKNKVSQKLSDRVNLL